MSSKQVTDPSAFEEGSLGLQVALAVVTLGLYALYWYYETNRQLAAGTDAEFDPVKRTVLMIVLSPILVGLYWIWKTANDAEAVTDQSGPVLFLLLITPLSPVGWYLIQSGINEIAQ